jgi:hypothetical protein
MDMEALNTCDASKHNPYLLEVANATSLQERWWRMPPRFKKGGGECHLASRKVVANATSSRCVQNELAWTISSIRRLFVGFPRLNWGEEHSDVLGHEGVARVILR